MGSLVCLVVFVGREAESSGAAEAGVASLVLLGLVVLLALGADCANPVISRLLASFRQEILYISLKHQQQMERLGRDGDGDLDGDASSSLFGTLCLSGGLPVSDVECEPAEQGPLKIMTTIPKISGFVDGFTSPEVPWVMDSNGCPDSWIVFVEHVAEMLDQFLVGECPQPFTMSIDTIGFVLNSDLSDKTQSAVDLLNSLHLAPLPSGAGISSAVAILEKALEKRRSRVRSGLFPTQSTQTRPSLIRGRTWTRPKQRIQSLLLPPNPPPPPPTPPPLTPRRGAWI